MPRDNFFCGYESDVFEQDFMVACEMMLGKSYEAAERRARRMMNVERAHRRREREAQGLPVVRRVFTTRACE